MMMNQITKIMTQITLITEKEMMMKVVMVSYSPCKMAGYN